jgi:hypothetical protein
MTLREFLTNINKMVEENPTILDLTVISASDAEGNGFSEVHYEPSIGVYSENEFHQLNEDEDFDDYGYTSDDINSICIN